VARLKEATVDEITAVPGIGVATATAVLEALRTDAGSKPAADDRVAERASG
jgi:excinuclease ABC subunit C